MEDKNKNHDKDASSSNAAAAPTGAEAPQKPKHPKPKIPREFDKPQINSSRYEAFAIQDAIRRLGSVRAEVEAELLAAIESSTGKGVRPGPERTIVYPNLAGGSGKSGEVGTYARAKSGKGTQQPKGVCETQQLISQRVYGPATKKLNVHPNERIYHDLLELNVPPTTVKLKRAPQCEKKIDPAPCLEDYIKPQYCSIKPVRDYMSTWTKCNIPQPSEEIANEPVCLDSYYDELNREYLRDHEPEFGIG